MHKLTKSPKSLAKFPNVIELQQMPSKLEYLIQNRLRRIHLTDELNKLAVIGSACSRTCGFCVCLWRWVSVEPTICARLFRLVLRPHYWQKPITTREKAITTKYRNGTWEQFDYIKRAHTHTYKVINRFTRRSGPNCTTHSHAQTRSQRCHSVPKCISKADWISGSIFAVTMDRPNLQKANREQVRVSRQAA